MTLYEKQIYHSDIKPENIVFGYDFLENKHKVYLIDFGSSSLDYKELNGYTKFYFIDGRLRKFK